MANLLLPAEIERKLWRFTNPAQNVALTDRPRAERALRRALARGATEKECLDALAYSRRKALEAPEDYLG